MRIYRKQVEDYYSDAEEYLIQEYFDDEGEDENYSPTASEIYEKAYELWCDFEDLYADYLYDRMKDEQMEREA